MPGVTDFIDHLTAERNRAWGEQRAIAERCLAERRIETAEERAVIERTDAAIDDIDKRAGEWRSRIERDNESAKAREHVDAILRPDQRSIVVNTDAIELDNLTAFLKGERRSVDIDLRPAARELAMIRGGAGRSEFRDLLTSAAAGAGTLVPSTLARTIYTYMETIGGPRTAGATIITTENGAPLNMGKVTSGGTAAAVGEGTAAAEADPAFGQVNLLAWDYAQLLQVSQNMVADSGVDLLGFIGEDTGRALGRVTNTAYTTGTGTNAPQGLVTGSRAAGTGVVGQTGSTGVPSYANLIDLEFSVADEAYAGPDSVFETKWSNMKDLRKLVDTTGRPLWAPSLVAGQPSTLNGYRIVSNPALAAWGTAASTYPMLFGDHRAAYVIRDVGSVQLQRSDDFAFSAGLITFRAVLRTDGKVRDTGAVKVMACATT